MPSPVTRINLVAIQKYFHPTDRQERAASSGVRYARANRIGDRQRRRPCGGGKLRHRTGPWLKRTPFRSEVPAGSSLSGVKRALAGDQSNGLSRNLAKSAQTARYTAVVFVFASSRKSSRGRRSTRIWPDANHIMCIRSAHRISFYNYQLSHRFTLVESQSSCQSPSHSVCWR